MRRSQSCFFSSTLIFRGDSKFGDPDMSQASNIVDSTIEQHSSGFRPDIDHLPLPIFTIYGFSNPGSQKADPTLPSSQKNSFALFSFAMTNETNFDQPGTFPTDFAQKSAQISQDVWDRICTDGIAQKLSMDNKSAAGSPQSDTAPTGSPSWVNTSPTWP